MPARARITVSSRLLNDLKQRIVAGEFVPGSRLPTRADLIGAYGTTPVTLQRVCDRLVREGFLVAHGRRGTFVSDRPPHLTVYALVFPYHSSPTRPWPRFWTALAAEARSVALASGRTLVFSYGNETHQDLAAYRELEENVRSHRLVGLIFASPPHYLSGSSVLEAPGIPRVALMARAAIPGVSTIRLTGSLMGELVRRLRQAGCRRVALFTVQEQAADAQRLLGEAGFRVPAHWVYQTNYTVTQSARQVAYLLMKNGPRTTRPDGILITDDNLTEPTLAGLADAGVRVPRDLTVVTHCNFPAPPPSLPIVRLGYDTRRVLAACLDSLEAQRLGGASGRVTEIPFTSEEELGT